MPGKKRSYNFMFYLSLHTKKNISNMEFVERKVNRIVDGFISHLYLVEYAEKCQWKWLQLIHIHFLAVRMETRTWWHLFKVIIFYSTFCNVLSSIKRTRYNLRCQLPLQHQRFSSVLSEPQKTAMCDFSTRADMGVWQTVLLGRLTYCFEVLLARW